MTSSYPNLPYTILFTSSHHMHFPFYSFVTPISHAVSSSPLPHPPLPCTILLTSSFKSPYPGIIPLTPSSHLHGFSLSQVWDIRENPARCTRTLSSAGLTSVGFPIPSTQSRTLQMPPGETLITDIAISTATNILYSAAGNIVRIWDLRK